MKKKYSRIPSIFMAVIMTCSVLLCFTACNDAEIEQSATKKPVKSATATLMATTSAEASATQGENTTAPTLNNIIVPTSSATAGSTTSATPQGSSQNTAKPSNSSVATSKPTSTQTAKPTPTPTKKPTATPTPTPKPASYPWSDAVTAYLTDTSRGYDEYIPIADLVTLKERDFAKSLSGTVFGECASEDYIYDIPGISVSGVGDNPIFESVNKNGIISQVYVTSWWDYLGNPQTGKKITGVYLDTSYTMPNAELRNFLGNDIANCFWEQHTAPECGTKVEISQAYMSTGHCMAYPLKNGNFVINYYGSPIILNSIPETVRIYYGYTDLSFSDHITQIAVDGRVIFDMKVCFGIY